MIVAVIEGREEGGETRRREREEWGRREEKKEGRGKGSGVLVRYLTFPRMLLIYLLAEISCR